MKYAKAFVAAIAAAAGSYATAMADSHVTTQEWVTIVIVAAAALGITWGVPNAPTPPTNPPA